MIAACVRGCVDTASYVRGGVDACSTVHSDACCFRLFIVAAAVVGGDGLEKYLAQQVDALVRCSAAMRCHVCRLDEIGQVIDTVDDVIGFWVVASLMVPFNDNLVALKILVAGVVSELAGVVVDPSIVVVGLIFIVIVVASGW